MRTWFALAALAAAQLAPAAETPDRRDRIASPVTDRFYLRGSYFSGSVDTSLRVDPAAGQPGTVLTAEDDLDLDDRIDQGRIELMVRMRERHKLRVDFFKVDRYAETLLEKDIVFGDETFQTGEHVVSSLDWRSLGFTYTYSFLRRERLELGAGLGIRLIEAEARGRALESQRREEESGVAPLPTLALDFAWRVTPRIALTARANYLGGAHRDVEASFADYHLDVQFRWRPNLAFGIGYQVFDVDVDSRDADDSGRFALDLDGPEAFVRVSF